MKNPANIASYDPKIDGGCAVAFGYDVDIPRDLAYLYNWELGWLAKPGGTAVTDYYHGHLNEDIVVYTRKLSSFSRVVG